MEMETYVQFYNNEEVKRVATSSLDKAIQGLIYRMKTVFNKFNGACSQVVLISNRIDLLEARCESKNCNSNESGISVVKCPISVNINIMDDVRTMYLKYANKCAEILDELQTELYERGVIDADIVIMEGSEDGEWYVNNVGYIDLSAYSSSSHSLFYSLLFYYGTATFSKKS